MTPARRPAAVTRRALLRGAAAGLAAAAAGATPAAASPPASAAAAPGTAPATPGTAPAGPDAAPAAPGVRGPAGGARRGGPPPVRWRTPLAGIGAFTLRDRIVYAMQGATLRALSAADGAPRWRVPVGPPDDARLLDVAVVAGAERVAATVTRHRPGPSGPTVVGDVFGADGALGYRLDSGRGDLHFFGDTLVRSVRASHSSFHYVEAYGPDGAVRWQTDDLGSAWLSGLPPVAGPAARALLTIEDDAGGTRLALVDTATGAARWSVDGVGQPAPLGLDEGDRLLVPLVPADGRRDRRTRLYWLDPATGAAASSVPVEEFAGQLRCGGTLFVVTYDGAVLALDPASGVARWRAHLDAPPAATALAASGGALLVWADDRVYPLDPASGAARGAPWPGVAAPVCADAAGVYARVGNELVAYAPPTG
ncbi:hypothetical protein GCM10010123_36770 [Pilimelia anulata]|uniref:Pyrrolo-quinoline quinone repeat domain-containing protein n=1 Tax=Pilimelia anulata TaxID=53371 RepID=A0A8J3B8N4_9ACTN|nr:PQQ-binding-like beta-propeller repeat protein [Pilimelia anulata]GGK03507.1 hypothetical protein GCM10010123_36770 [Pilimelia anulata]